MNLKDIVEAALFAAGRPLSVEEIGLLFDEAERPDSEAIEGALVDVSKDYEGRPIEVRRVASGYRFQVRGGLSHWLSRLFEERPARYSRALLETLAIIAYRQPATRGEIEDIRGVAVSSGTIRTLLEREWVQVVGHKEVPGRPALYATTREFLDYFGLRALDDLPDLPEFKELVGANSTETMDTAEVESAAEAAVLAPDDSTDPTPEPSDDALAGDLETAEAHDEHEL